MKYILNDDNITARGDTGWMDSLDPNFGPIADLWMRTLIDDFGTDHWYQMDGYFDGGTAPWMTSTSTSSSRRGEKGGGGGGARTKDDPSRQEEPFDPAEEVTRDDTAYRRASAAYAGLNRTDPYAVWSFQGWAIRGWSTSEQASVLRGFVESVPSPDKFVIVDMETDGSGQWRQWNESAFFGSKFVWTTLHDFGGADGIKGNLSKINRIPFDAPPSVRSNDQVAGTGATPEGIDQNPAYYEFLFENHFRASPVENITDRMINRAHRRYGLREYDDDVARAWASLVDGGMYSVDVGVRDNFGVVHLPAESGRHPNGPYWPFMKDRRTPEPIL
uniref:Alpha-N-acetylglucosaminidase tim-barrel domain-containing protein n=1 Tax=Odontella aurita TaxID=265563 RepID=A0A7S4NBL1_9STRA